MKKLKLLPLILIVALALCAFIACEEENTEPCVEHFDENGELLALESVRTSKKALMRQCELLREYIGDRDPKDYLLWHLYTGTSLLNTLKEIEGRYGIECNHEDVIMSPVSGCHNGPWLAGYGLVFLRREDEPLEA